MVKRIKKYPKTFIVALIFGCGLLCGWIMHTRMTATTPEEARFGLLPNHAELAAPVAAAMPEFEIQGVFRDNTKANVRLWHAVLKFNNGQHIPNIPQQIGDCVSWGARNAVVYLQFAQLDTPPPGQPAEYHDVFPPWIYGASRVWIGGGKIHGDGSVGAWAAEAVRVHGLLRSDFPGVPAYQGSVAKLWGSKGPPEEFRPEAKQFVVQTTSPVRNSADVRDAVCNGYPCTIASDCGFLMTPPVIDGRLLNHRSGHWGHQMAVIAFDGSGPEPLFYIINSWGPNAHGAPPDDSPPGGFWVRARDIDYITSQGDSYAFSSFKGFPSQELNFNVIGRRGRNRVQRERHLAGHAKQQAF